MMMNRRTWALSACLVGTALAFPTIALAQPVTLKFSHEAPETAIKGRSAKLMAELVEKYTNGTVKVEVFPGGQLIPTNEELRAAIRGQVDIVAPYSSYYSALDTGWDVFYQPMLFKSVEAGMDAYNGPIGVELLKRLEPKGLRGLAMWHDGPVYAFTTGAPAASPEAFKGLKVRVAASKPQEALLSKVGATTISMPATEVYMALQQGVASGVISTPTYAAPARWGEVLKSMVRASWGMGGYGVAMNQRSWAKLNPQQQEGFMKAVRETEAWNRSQSQQNIKDQEAALEKAGLKLSDPTPQQVQAWEALVKPIWDAQPAETKRLMGMVK
ncbi:MAG: TRAP transporter substrate-binding protein [Comamonadaceae bacterium]|nr:MAG: TRAP transporter substrate-binding protein [Comamonadaceae bacterium]